MNGAFARSDDGGERHRSVEGGQIMSNGRVGSSGMGELYEDDWNELDIVSRIGD